MLLFQDDNLDDGDEEDDDDDDAVGGGTQKCTMLETLRSRRSGNNLMIE